MARWPEIQSSRGPKQQSGKKQQSSKARKQQVNWMPMTRRPPGPICCSADLLLCFQSLSPVSTTEGHRGPRREERRAPELIQCSVALRVLRGESIGYARSLLFPPRPSAISVVHKTPPVCLFCGYLASPSRALSLSLTNPDGPAAGTGRCVMLASGRHGLHGQPALNDKTKVTRSRRFRRPSSFRSAIGLAAR